MTIGEKILALRKQMGLSQEELGAKLSLSRQTVSLWETDQTMPTLDNLIRLKEIFGVSLDELVTGQETSENAAKVPTEEYEFSFAKEEIFAACRSRLEVYFLRIAGIAVCVLLIAVWVMRSASSSYAYGLFAVGGLFWLAFMLRYFFRLKRQFKEIAGRVEKNRYRYIIFEDEILSVVFCGDEEIQRTRIPFSEISSLKTANGLFSLEHRGLLYFLRKEELPSESRFLRFYYEFSERAATRLPTGKQYLWSLILFLESLLSLVGGIALAGLLSAQNGKFTENMWTFFLFLPISVASICYGQYLKKQRIKWKKNILFGWIISVLLLIYGSFSFLF